MPGVVVGGDGVGKVPDHGLPAEVAHVRAGEDLLQGGPEGEVVGAAVDPGLEERGHPVLGPTRYLPRV